MPDSKDQLKQPQPEVLKAQSNTAKPAEDQTAAAKTVKTPRRHITYRPSHKATFIGLGVVVAILLINVAVITFVVRGNGQANADSAQPGVSISSDVLDKLGVSRNTVDTSGTVLTIGPDASFEGSVTMADNVSIAGQLKLNSKFSANDASLTNLQAGKTQLQELNVNGDATITNLSLRKDLKVAGVSYLQGPVTMSNLLTVNNNLNVAGNLSIGGVLSASSFHASNLASDSTLTIGGHIITTGAAPSVSGGSALGSGGTVSISGSDASGTVAVNIGVGAGSGTVAYVSFRSQYSNTPHVMVTPIGRGVGSFYVNRSASGFSIVVTGSLPPGGYAFDYIIMQ